MKETPEEKPTPPDTSWFGVCAIVMVALAGLAFLFYRQAITGQRLSLAWFRVNVLPVFRLGARLSDKMPARGDGPMTYVVKMLGVFDAINETYGNNDQWLGLPEEYGLKYVANQTLAEMAHKLATTHYTVRVHRVDNEKRIMELRQGWRLEFLIGMYTKNTGEVSLWTGCYVVDDAAITDLCERYWKLYPNGMYLSVNQDDRYHWERGSTKVAELPRLNARCSSKTARDRITKIVECSKNFAGDGMQRTYLLHGPPGTGKTSGAIAIAEALGGRLMAINAESLDYVQAGELDTIVAFMAPHVVLIDDMDRAFSGQASSKILLILQSLKIKCPRSVVVITANNTNRLDHALLRCGRIDESVLFGIPDADERRELVEDLVTAYGIENKVSAELRAEIAQRSDGLTHAYINDMVMRMRHGEPASVMASVLELHALAQKSANGGK